MKRQYDESGAWFLAGMGKSGFKGATSDKRYVQILKYIGDHDGCTKMDVLHGIGSNNFGKGQYSDMFAALKIAGLIEYDRKNNEYHITEEGIDVLKNSYLNDMERIATGRKSFESTKRQPKIKRLNITKESFEKSNYFKNKYGKLEYVSESGKLFKTNKGKILMFKESERPKFKKGAEVEVTDDFIRTVNDPDFPKYGWIVRKSRSLMDEPGFEYLISRDPEFAEDDGYDGEYWVYDNEIR